MFTQLYNLFNNNSRKKPLEDFTTELLAGVLQSHPDICKRFCKEVLRMKGETFRVRTQAYFPTLVEDRMNCYVDMLIENPKEICFIENKVHSKEGFEQLERYASVLDSYESHTTYLKYCTKQYDPKPEIKRQYAVKHHFSQFQWHEYGEFLLDYIDRPLVKHFINFLEQHGMHTDMTLTPSDLMGMENFQRVYIWINSILDKSKNTFSQHFGGVIDPRKVQEFHQQLFDQNRFCLYVRNPIPDSEESEILYSIDLDGNATVQIYLDQNHSSFSTFKELAGQAGNEFKYETLEHGGRLVAQKNLATLINNKEGEKILQDWFVARFSQIAEFILNSYRENELNWKPEVIEHVKEILEHKPTE